MSDFQLPDHLSDAARAFFEQTRDIRRLKSPMDLQKLLNAVEVWDRAEWCRAECVKLGATITDRFGQEKPNPLLENERKLRETLRLLLHLLPDHRTYDEKIEAGER